MQSYNIALIPGDGTGPEVLKEGVKALDAAATRYGIKLNYQNYDFGAERYLRTGETLPDSAIEDFKKHDAIFLGAIGHPDVKPGILELGILLKARFALDQYINLRPVKLYPNVETPLKDKGPEHIDFVVIRENTGGIYTGMGGVMQKGTPNEIASQVMVYSRSIVDRCMRYAYEFTKRRNKKNMLTLLPINATFSRTAGICGCVPIRKWATRIILKSSRIIITWTPPLCGLSSSRNITT